MKQFIPVFIFLQIVLIPPLAIQAQNNISSMVPVSAVSAAPKLCSCQLLEIQSQDYIKHRIGIFAEKDQAGKSINSYRMMNAMISREKTYLRKGFASEVKLLNKYTSNTDCMTLYYQLKQQHGNFMMFDILNVNVLLDIARR